MLKYIFGLALLMVSQGSFATSVKFKSTNHSKFSEFILAANAPASVPMVETRFSPSNAKQGDLVSAFVEIKTSFSEGGVRTLLMGKLDGSPVKLVHRAPNIWVMQPTQIQNMGNHQLEVEIFLEDQVASSEIRKALSILNQEIIKTQEDITREADPAKVTLLQGVLSSKLQQKTDLENTLTSLKRAIGSKIEKFSVGPAGIGNMIYPALETISPQVFAPQSGSLITLTGKNLQGVDKVVIGGVEIPQDSLAVTNTTVNFSSPTLQLGLHDVSVSKLINGERVYFKLDHAFFVANVSSGGGSSHPVAFAGVPVSGKANTAISLDGSQSYDPAENALSYQWSVVSKPHGSPNNDGNFPDATIVNPTFTAATEGTWIVSLVVNNGTKSSAPSLTTIQVGSAEAISIIPGQISSAQPRMQTSQGQVKVCNNLTEKITLGASKGGDIIWKNITQMDIGPLACVHLSWMANSKDKSISGNTNMVVIEPVQKSFNIPFTISVLNTAIKFYMDPMGTSELTQTELSPGSGTYTGPNISFPNSYDGPGNTFLFVKNVSMNPVQINTLPVFSSANLSSNFPPAGITLMPEMVQEVRISTTSVVGGPFDMVWKVLPNEIAKTITIVTPRLLPAPARYIYEWTFPDTLHGAFAPGPDIDFCITFFNDPMCGMIEINIEEISYEYGAGTPSGTFNFDHTWGPFFPHPLRAWENPWASRIMTRFNAVTLGNLETTMKVKLRGYTQQFKIVLKGKAVMP